MNKLITLCLFIPTFAFANLAQFGRVVEIKGSGFISHMGKTHEIQKGEILYVESEIVVESAGQVTFTDNADHRFHIGHSSSVALFPTKVELRSGDVWIQSINKQDNYTVTTANAEVSYSGGESIVSYDSLKGKTQVMVINGMMKVANLRAPELNLNVAEGNFSFVDLNYEEGMPRDPTPVGEKTYKKLVSLFQGVGPMDSHSAEIFKDKPAVAEVKHEEVSKHGEKVEAKELNKEVKREIASISVKPQFKKVKSPSKVFKGNALVQIFGQKTSAPISTMAIYDMPKTESATTTSKRAPASVPEIVTDEEVPSASKSNPVQDSPQYKESEKLIESLKKL